MSWWWGQWGRWGGGRAARRWSLGSGSSPPEHQRKYKWRSNGSKVSHGNYFMPSKAYKTATFWTEIPLTECLFLPLSWNYDNTPNCSVGGYSPKVVGHLQMLATSLTSPFQLLPHSLIKQKFWKSRMWGQVNKKKGQIIYDQICQRSLLNVVLICKTIRNQIIYHCLCSLIASYQTQTGNHHPILQTAFGRGF